jgi:hypothetical protein
LKGLRVYEAGLDQVKFMGSRSIYYLDLREMDMSRNYIYKNHSDFFTRMARLSEYTSIYGPNWLMEHPELTTSDEKYYLHSIGIHVDMRHLEFDGVGCA